MVACSLCYHLQVTHYFSIHLHVFFWYFNFPSLSFAYVFYFMSVFLSLLPFILLSSISVSVFSFSQTGSSHQLFHICAVVGTHFQMEAVLADMTSRSAWLTAQGAIPSFRGTVGALALGLLLNLGIIGIFSAPLLWNPRQSSNQPHMLPCEDKEQ